MADIPITGDWNGDGFSKIGVFRKGMWYLDYNGNGKWDGCGDTPTTDRCYNFGLTTDIPVAGDWNNDGQTEIGIFRNGSWYLDYKGNGGWDGCGITTATDRCLSFGASGDIPVVGDWNGDGFTEVGTKRGVSWYLDYSGNAVWSGCGLTPATDRCYNFGLASDKPLSGIW
jgi:hypothetical protein